MKSWTIQGGTPLKGAVKISGAKNAIIKMIVASMISSKASIFDNVPNIHDVEVTLNMCASLGMQFDWDRSQHRLKVRTPTITSTNIPLEFSGTNRIPILLVGALANRTQELITIPSPGGCKIGKRPIDFHQKGLSLLGIDISEDKEHYKVEFPQTLTGTLIDLPYPSVMATENVLLAACACEGTTVIKNAAIEPEITDLIHYLQKMGANIHCDAHRTLIITKCNDFYSVQHTVLTDRMQAGSLALAAIATKGSIFLEGAKQEHLSLLLNLIRKMGGHFHVRPGGILCESNGPLTGGIHIETGAFPGFPTDLQPQLATVLTQCRGSSVIHETVYEQRFSYVNTLKKMGAHLEGFSECLGPRSCRFHNKNYKHSLIIHGATALRGDTIEIPDLRAGFAYVLAGLVAKETTTLTGLHFLDRGYEQLDATLCSLGGKIYTDKALKL